MQLGAVANKEEEATTKLVQDHCPIKPTGFPFQIGLAL
jgi:hypothetical protein